MSTVLEPPKTPQSSQFDVKPELPDASVLEDRTPEWVRTTPVSALFVLLIGFVFVILANRPLWHTDLWDHLNYGQNIIETRTVSDTEPLMYLCRGVRMINIPWLAQVGMAAVNSRFGLTGLQFGYGLLIAMCLAVVAYRSVRLSHSAVGGIIACAIFLKVNLDQLLVIRPQLGGVLFYCIVVAWMFGRVKHSKFVWIGMPLMYALWANIHGSFSMGLMLMGLTGLGRFGDVLVISKSLRIALLDREFHRTILLTQLCAAAALLNPSGLAIYPEVFNVAGNPNINSMFEWDALTLRTAQGQSAAAAALLAFMAIKLSPRRLHCGEMLAFVLTGLLAMWSGRMLNWWAPIAGIVTGTHLIASMRKTTAWLKNPQPGKRTGLWTVVSLGLVWILFALTSFGMQVMRGRIPAGLSLVSSETPVATLAFLNSEEKLPSGIAFVPAEWAGYVMNSGMNTVEPMVNLHVHITPEQVWNDYVRLVNGPSDWQSLMDEYGINLAIVDKDRHPGLLKRIRESADWSAQYEDRQAVVFFRKKEI
jgi:hypothetical protein